MDPIGCGFFRSDSASYLTLTVVHMLKDLLGLGVSFLCAILPRRLYVRSDRSSSQDEPTTVRMQEMFRHMNRMMQEKLEGIDPDFEGFMEQFDPLFGENPPQTFDELMERKS